MRNGVRGMLLGFGAVVFVAVVWNPQAPQGATEGGAAPQSPAGRGTETPVVPAPRLPDGTVNLGRVPGEKGYWRVQYITNMGMRLVGRDGQLLPEIQQAQAAGRAVGAGGAAQGGSGRGGAKSEPWIPWMPWSAALYDYNSRNTSKYDPEGYCLPPGGPRLMATPYPMEIIQLPEQRRILMIFEGATHIWREIYMDARPHPQGDALNPTYLGHAVGRWEGDTLLIDVVGFNENTWLDYFGHPHTDKLQVVERFSRPNKSTLHYEATVTDPGAYTRPFTIAWDIPWEANGELQEYICQENNQYLSHLADDFGQPIFGPRPQPGELPSRSDDTR